ncbi:MAG: VacJ family lipoprotein [Alphaproteobacteria bacterium]
MRIYRFAALFLLTFAIGVIIPFYGGPAAAQTAEFDNTNDPIEPFNRAVFEFNRYADALLIKPLALLYRDFVPPPLRTGVHNALANLRTPITLANDLMQGEMTRAGVTVQRFAINSTIGIGGLFDFATDFGIEGHREDFGQTLAIWGSGEGFYLVLPLFGPSSGRDGIGLAVDTFLDPLIYFAPTNALAARTLIRGVDEREGVIDTLDEIERTSLDFYATLRSLYRQHRGDEIRNGAPAPVLPIPSISIDDFEDIEDVDGETAALIN